MRRPAAPEGEICPLHRRDTSEVCHRCPWYTLLRGTNPQTGIEVDEWGCAVAMLPILLIENAKETRQGAAATESFRNAVLGLARSATGAAVADDSTDPPRRLVR